MSNRSPDLEYFAENELIARRLEKAENLREEGIDPYYNGFSVTHSTADVFKQYAQVGQEQLESDPVEVSVAGRLRFHRRMGKASFLKIQDWSTRVGSKPPGIKLD
jgi:lysyl-tRNA synthetase class 2